MGDLCDTQVVASLDVDLGVLVGPVLTEKYVYVTFWQDTSKWELYRAPRCELGGDFELLDSGDGYIRSLDSLGETLFVGRWGDQDNNYEPPPQIGTIKDDDDYENLLPAPAAARQFWPTPDVLFWIGAQPEVGGSRGAQVTDLMTLETTFWGDSDLWEGVTADHEAVFWGGVGGVRRAFIGDQDFEVVMPLERTAAVTVAGDWLVGYDVDGPNGLQQVFVSDKDGSEKQLLFEGQLWPHFVVDDEDRVYLRTSDFSDGEPPELDLYRFTLPDGEPELIMREPLYADFDIREGWLYAYSLTRGLVRVPIE